MHSLPRIGIPVPTSFDLGYNAQCWPEYAGAVTRCGGEAVRMELGLSASALRELASTLSGVILPGSGADVSPERYGHERAAETAPADPLREENDAHLLEYVDREGLPLLAICFGLQSLNVHRGGTLVQHLTPMPVNHRAGRAVARAHAVQIARQSMIGRVAESTDLFHVEHDFVIGMVNSSHHQAVGAVGDQLRVAARSTEDAVIEAVEDESHPFLLGLQWHPERTMESEPYSRLLFERFLLAATRAAA